MKFAPRNMSFRPIGLQSFLNPFWVDPRGISTFKIAAREGPSKELVRIMLGEYDSDANLLAAQAQLERITMKQVMRDGEITESDKD